MKNKPSSAQPYDVTEIIDATPWGWRQWVVLFLCSLAIIFDGLDNQLIGFAIPGMIKEWGVARDQFSIVLALGFIGMTIGTPIGGWLGDRIGRKSTLVLSVMLFAIGTACSALAHGITELAICRTIAGIGLGGAMPVAMTLMAESTPAKRRSLAVTLCSGCIPLGGLIGGIIAAQILPIFGWRTLFAIGGIAPLAIAAILFFLLPETPHFIALRSKDPKRVIARLRALGCTVPDDAQFVVRTQGQKIENASFGALFKGGMGLNTLAMSATFFFSLLSLYVVYAWTPTLLTSVGFDIATASKAVAMFNFGGIIGFIVLAFLIGKFGSRVTMSTYLISGVVVAILIAFSRLSIDASAIVTWQLFVLGFCLLPIVVTSYTLAAHVFPPSIRSTGIGASAGIGRIGAIVSSYIGAAVLAIGPNNFFLSIGVSLAITAVALMVLRIHIPAGRSTSQAAPAMPVPDQKEQAL